MKATEHLRLARLLGLGSMLLLCLLLAAVGPPAGTTLLRLSHRIDPKNSEHAFRTATNHDGKHRIWGGIWILPADKKQHIGLILLGKDPNDSFQATAKFDYVSIYQP
jgi:arabinan endo-1,5-alpha-L-arabinosidase